MEATEASPERGIDQTDVYDKYKVAGQIVDQAFDLVRKAAYVGMNVRTMCQLGDALIQKSCSNVYSKARSENGEKLDKGVAFPTCVCVRNCASHFCPIETDPEASTTLNQGDMITVQLGAHIDGYSAIAAQTIAVKPDKESTPPPVEDKAADVVMAAYTAADAAMRLMRAGEINDSVTKVIASVAEDFGVTPLEGVLSHQLKRFVTDGTKVIMNRETAETHADSWEFENFEVYNLDIVMSSGEGKAIQRDTRETIYKRQVDVDYKLKMKSSRQVFSEINKSFPTMPFTLRALEDPRKSRMAMTEIAKHALVTPYPVLYEKDGVALARCSLTVLITPTQTTSVTKNIMPEVKSEKSVKDQFVLDALSVSLDRRKKKKKKKKAPSAEEGDAKDGDMMES